MNELPRVSAHIKPSELADLVDEFGGAIVENIIAPDAVAAVRSELKRFVEATPKGNDEFEGKKTSRTGGLVARSEAARSIVANPLVLGTVAEIFGSDTRFQLNQTQLIAIGPGETGQPMHRDQWIYGFFPFPPGYEALIQTMWALTPFTAENGATRYVPGSHRDSELTRLVRQGRRYRLDYKINSDPQTIRYRPEDSIPVIMDAGSMVMWSGKLYHGGGPNRSSETRWGLNVGYTRGWLRQEENQYLAMTPEAFAQIDDEFARMAGWARTSYGHGYVGDMRDPLDVARGRSGHQGFGDPITAPNALGDV